MEKTDKMKLELSTALQNEIRKKAFQDDIGMLTFH